MRRHFSVVALVVAIGSSVAYADDPSFTIGPKPAWFLLGGVTSGGTVAFGGRGAFVGGELSLARLMRGNHVGLYADGYYDWGADGTYVTGGLEGGWKFIGVDAGAAFRFADGQTQTGVAARLSVGIGVFNVFVRYAQFDTMNDDHVLQVGATVKLPLFTFGGPR